MANSLSYVDLDMINDQNIGKNEYIGNWILWIYGNISKISMDIFTKISGKDKIIKKL